MSKVRDLTGQRFGRLTVIERTEDIVYTSGQKKVAWLCKCDCGNKKIVKSSCLKEGTVQSCGCYNKECSSKRRFIDLTGYKYNMLTVIKRVDDYIETNGNHSVYWLCQCDCGNTTIVQASNLKSGAVKSCGCLLEQTRRIYEDLTNQTFGKWTVLSRNYEHGENEVYWNCICKCGNKGIVPSGQLKNGHSKSCGCIKSIGEHNINTYLSKNNINYQSQKKFDNLIGIGGNPLSYDFYLPDYKILIEAQGIQHEKSVELFGGKEQFERQQEHDKRKKEYAENNGYKLLEIWYYDYDRIEEILVKELEVI